MSTVLTSKSSTKAQPTFQDRRLFLKIKLKNLAEEARIIRKEEKRTTKAKRDGEKVVFRKNARLLYELWEHRTKLLRHEARHTLLAYGFLRGKDRQAIEQTKKAIDWTKVEAMVKKYGTVYGGDSQAADAAENTRRMAAFKKWQN